MNSSMSNVKHLPGFPFKQNEFSLRDKLIYQVQRSTRSFLDFAKFSYIVLVMLLLLCAVVELKQIFNVDVFPGIDTPIDNAYFAGKSQIDGNVL